MKRLPVIIISIMLIFFSSCKDENQETDYNPNINTAVESIWAQLAFNDVFYQVFMATSDTTLINTGYNKINGAQVFYSEDPNPLIRIRFPDYFFQCPDDRNRRGEFHASFNGPIGQPGVSANIAYMGYYFEFIRLDASHAIIFEGKNTSQLEAYTNEIYSGNLLVMDTLSPYAYTWNASQQLVWSEGTGTPYDHQDDCFLITGNSNGKSSSSVDYNTEITTELLGCIFACKWITYGIQQISTPGLLATSGQINFLVQDSCNNYVGFYFDGNPFYTKLKKVR